MIPFKFEIRVNDYNETTKWPVYRTGRRYMKPEKWSRWLEEGKFPNKNHKGLCDNNILCTCIKYLMDSTFFITLNCKLITKLRFHALKLRNYFCIVWTLFCTNVLWGFFQIWLSFSARLTFFMHFCFIWYPCHFCGWRDNSARSSKCHKILVHLRIRHLRGRSQTTFTRGGG